MDRDCTLTIDQLRVRLDTELENFVGYSTQKAEYHAKYKQERAKVLQEYLNNGQKGTIAMTLTDGDARVVDFLLKRDMAKEKAAAAQEEINKLKLFVRTEEAMA